MSSAGDGGSSERARPKFRPKAQARKKASPPPPPAVDDYRAAAASYRSGAGGGAAGGASEGRGHSEGYRGRQDSRRKGGRGFEGRGHRPWEDRSKGRGSGRGRGGRGRDDSRRGRDGGFRGGGGGRGRGGFIPVGQDFFVGGGGSGPAAYMPSGITIDGSGGGGVRGGDHARGGRDTSESEAEAEDRKRLVRSKKKDASSDRKPSSGKGRDSTTATADGDDEDMFGIGGWADEEGEDEGDRAAAASSKGDVFSLMGAPGSNRHRSRSTKVPGMKVTGNVMSEEDGMRPVALPVTATAQDPTARLFAPADNEAELEEEEDSSLFFVQLPTKLPRPLPAFQRRSVAGGSSKGKGKAKSSGHVKEEVDDGSAAAGGASSVEGGAGGGSAGASAASGGGGKNPGETAAFPGDEVAFDQGLRRMRPGKVGKLYVHKSGHVRLVIGGVSLSMQSGLAVSFVEEGVSIDAGLNKSFCSFGQVTKRAICTPDFEQLYRRAHEASAEGHGAGGAGGGNAGPVKMEVE